MTSARRGRDGGFKNCPILRTDKTDRLLEMRTRGRGGLKSRKFRGRHMYMAPLQPGKNCETGAVAVQCTRVHGDRERGRIGCVDGLPALRKRHGPLHITVSRKEEPSTHEVDGKRQAGEVRECGRCGISSLRKKMCANLVIPDECFANVEMKLAHLRLLLLSPCPIFSFPRFRAY